MKLIQSYVNHKGQWFFVSTINRESSTDEPVVFAETMAWRINNDNSREDLVAQESDVANCVETHIIVMSDLYKKGCR